METYSEKMKRKREANAKQQHPTKKLKLLPESVDKTVVVLLGPPAVGKGTQAALLSKKYSYHHISMGELLRAASEEEGERGQYIREHWTLKDLNEIAFQLLTSEITNHLTDDKVRGFIIDGTPKTIDGVFQLNSVLTDFGLKVNCVFLMDIADLDVLSNRLKQRVESSKEKQRDDDKNEVLDIRLSNFFKQIELIKQYYEKLGLLFKIDAANEKEVIFESISSVVDDLPQKININQTKVAHENEVAMKSIKKQLTSKQMNTDLVGEIVQDADQWSHMLNQLLKCCRAKIWTFPGKIPVNVTKQSMRQMTSDDWIVTSKANGTRYLLFIYQQKAYFVNRKLDFFYAPQVNVSSHQLYSILDGEMVIETTPAANEEVASSSLRFLVHDTLYLDGKFVGGMTLADRMQRVKSTVNKITQVNEHEYPAIYISVKKYHPIYQLKHVIKGVIPQERIKNDGLIFAYKYGKYKLGKDELTLKWKPLDQCTADYITKNRTVLQGGKKIRFELFIQKGPQLVQSDECLVLDEESELFDELQDDMIVECKLVADVTSHSFTCVPLKIRTDKSHPNADWVLSSIKSTVLEWKDVDLNAIYAHFDLDAEQTESALPLLVNM